MAVAMLTPTLVFCAVLSGLGFGLMSIAYRMGQQRSVPTQSVAFIVTLVGGAYFLACTWHEPFWQAPW